jgi:hypothetical protein
MIANRRVVLLVVALGACCGCNEAARSPAARKKDWPLSNVGTMPAEITVVSGTTFRCGSVPCQLLGVKEADAPATREQADEFTRLWFKSVGNYIGIYNDSNPLLDEDGTAIVWIRGYDSSLSCLSEELVRAGLVVIDEPKWKDYTFTVPTKAGETQEEWQDILRKAKERHERGERPHVLFEWPPK